MVKRISFNRPQHEIARDPLGWIVRDKEPILDGHKRVYMTVSAIDVTTGPQKIRFGTGGEEPKWHEEEPAAAADTVYTTRKEYHVRQQDKGVINFVSASPNDHCIVVWHGYDCEYDEEI